ncbi:MAG: VWA domain-containing protein [Ideonella sp.]|nr:VWA domain-containing protein [Ideonella sp.]MCC7458393.1 VWA domain-containing protein [Nitrospira sp.]
MLGSSEARPHEAPDDPTPTWPETSDHPLAPLPAGRVLVCIVIAILAALALVAWSPAQAEDTDARVPESPYFQVRSDDPTLDALPLKSTQVEVRIAGIIAEVVVRQHYRNEGQRPIEARYVFPGSTQAAVHAMNVRLGERLIRAEIREKQRARLEYDSAKREGKATALLEQVRPNVFSMNVANILPGDDVQVELQYTELIAPHDGAYRFVFPTVVGPRYRSPAEAPANGAFPATAHLLPGVHSNTAFDLSVQLDAPLPIRDVRSGTHKLEAQGIGSTRVALALADEGPRDDRDFILEYRLADEKTATGLMLYRAPDAPDAENFFLALVEPPQVVAPVQINPRDYIFVVDISGSMHGQPLATAKTLLRNLIGALRPNDTFNVVLFSGSSRVLAESSVPATQGNIERAIRTIDRAGGGGSTEIVPALRRVAALPKPADVSRSVIVITDGYVAVENEVFQLVRRNLDQANVFAFGIGSSVNRHLIEGIARAGQGEAFIVTRPERAAEQAERLRHMIDSPVLTQLRARFVGLEVYDVEPAALPDVMAGRPVLLWGKWRGDASGAKLVLQGESASGSLTEVIDAPAPDPDARALRQLWARQRIAQLADDEALLGGQTQREPITALGLKYGLLTNYTSFVAVDQVVRTQQPATAVTPPLPLPQGVSALAVGTPQAIAAVVPSTPEQPVTVALALMALGAIGMVAWRRRVPARTADRASQDAFARIGARTGGRP